MFELGVDFKGEYEKVSIKSNGLWEASCNRGGQHDSWALLRAVYLIQCLCLLSARSHCQGLLPGWPSSCLLLLAGVQPWPLSNHGAA